MPYRRAISALLLPATLLLFNGCTKTVWVGSDELRPEDTERVNGVVTVEGLELELEPGAASIQGDTLYANVNGELFRIALGDVARVGLKRSNPLATVGLVLGICAGVAAVAYVVLMISLVSSLE